VTPSIGPRTLLIDALAADRHGHRQIIHKLGTLNIRRAR
jgi:hypothetical protein